MKRQHWLDQKSRLDQLFAYHDQLPEVPIEIRVHWVRYLVVLTSGFVESSLTYIYSEYATDKATPRLQKYISGKLDNPGNMKMEKLIRLIKEFGDDWCDEIVVHKDFDIMKSSLDSIVSNRNNIAHGESVSVTLTQLTSYYESTFKLLGMIWDQCDSESQSHRLSRQQRRKI